MKDALGAPQSILILGGTSDIAIATAKKLSARRTKTVVLAGRNPAALEIAAAEIKQAGATDVHTVAFDALAFDTHESFVNQQFGEHGGFDLVLLAFGALGDQEQGEANPKSAVQVIETNFTGAACVLLSVATKLREQGRGTIAVLSSVAGERARAANFIYGSSKAGLDAFCQGLGDSLVGSGVSVMIVRPGFVKSKMTAHMPDKPMATTPDGVADALISGLGKGSEMVWAPAQLRIVFSVFRHMPRSVFRRVKA